MFLTETRCKIGFICKIQLLNKKSGWSKAPLRGGRGVRRFIENVINSKPFFICAGRMKCCELEFIHGACGIFQNIETSSDIKRLTFIPLHNFSSPSIFPSTELSLGEELSSISSSIFFMSSNVSARLPRAASTF